MRLLLVLLILGLTSAGPVRGATAAVGFEPTESSGGCGLPRYCRRPTPPLRVPVHPLRHAAVSDSIRGIATWYDAPSVQDAAAGPPLRVGDWRGSRVRVTANGRSVVVRLTDFCACPGRLIDLDDDAFSQLAPLSRGVLSVTVTRLGSIPLPATDTEELP